MTSFGVVRGYGFEHWRTNAPFASPGGGEPVTAWENAGGELVEAVCGTDHEREVRVGTRWQKAQRAEIAFWRNWRSNVLYKHVSLEDFWADVVGKTGGPLPSGLVLDVGCGPVSVLNFVRAEGMWPIGLDPLAQAYANEGLVECRSGWEPMPMISLSAEALPFADASLDHLICYNVLDHVANAPAVLAEMERILKPGGTARVYVHTFASWIKNFLFFDKPHTYHWDHEAFIALVQRGGFNILRELKEPKAFDLPKALIEKAKHFPYWVATKVAYTSYFQLQKPKESPSRGEKSAR